MSGLVILIIVLLAAAAVLALAEALLPTGGLVGVVAAVAALAAVVAGFYHSTWLGIALLVVVAVSTPIFAVGAIHLWPYTPAGKALTMRPVSSAVEAPPVGVGAVGVAVSELRPTGLCEFGPQRLEARSESGIIPAGAGVRVVLVDQGRLIVRATATA